MLADPAARRGDRRHLRRLPRPGRRHGARGRQARPLREAARRRGRGGRRASAAVVARSGKVLQVGHMKRFDAGIEAAKAFVDDEMGQRLALKAWYCDSTHRYAMTDAVQPLIVTSASARKPAENPKADLRRYYMLAHGSHLVDTARYLFGPIEAVDARLTERFGAYCWFVDRRLRRRHARPSRPDRRGPDGLARGLPDLRRERQRRSAKTYNPWYYKTQRGRHLPRGRRQLAPPARRRRPLLPPPARGLRRRRSSTARRWAAPTSRTASPRCAAWWRSRARSRPAGRSRSPTSTGPV